MENIRTPEGVARLASDLRRIGWQDDCHTRGLPVLRKSANSRTGFISFSVQADGQTAVVLLGVRYYRDFTYGEVFPDTSSAVTINNAFELAVR